MLYVNCLSCNLVIFTVIIVYSDFNTERVMNGLVIFMMN